MAFSFVTRVATQAAEAEAAQATTQQRPDESVAAWAAESSGGGGGRRRSRPETAGDQRTDVKRRQPQQDFGKMPAYFGNGDAGGYGAFDQRQGFGNASTVVSVDSSSGSGVYGEDRKMVSRRTGGPPLFDSKEDFAKNGSGRDFHASSRGGGGNVRTQKKAYMQQLEQMVRDMKGERQRVEEASVAERQLLEGTKIARRRALETLFQYRARGEVSESKWATILDANDFELSLPVTPYRSYDPRETMDAEVSGNGGRKNSFGGGTDRRSGSTPLAGARRVCKGIKGMIFDTASLAVMLQSVGARHRRGHRLLRCKYDLQHDGVLFDLRSQAMGLWSMRTLNAVDCGAKAECVTQGMFQASFNNATNKITRLTLYFDVYAFMRELRVARGSPIIELIPNTLSGALNILRADDQRQTDEKQQRSGSEEGSGNGREDESNLDERGDDDGKQGVTPRMSKHPRQRRRRNMAHHLDDEPGARVITVASRPHNITHANRAFVELCGFSLDEAVGRSLRIIHGPATDESVVGDLIGDVARGLPASMIVVNYRRNGERFINYLRVFPLVHDGRITHFFGELERLDHEAVLQVENTPSPEWKLEDASSAAERNREEGGGLGGGGNDNSGDGKHGVFDAGGVNSDENAIGMHLDELPVNTDNNTKLSTSESNPHQQKQEQQLNGEDVIRGGDRQQ